MRYFPVLLWFAALVGCSHLDTRATGVDFSGKWRLDAGASDAALPLPRSRADQEEERPNVSGAPPPRFVGPSPLLPMLTATEMTISEDATGMGIAYPDQPYRDIKWGEQKRTLYVVNAGWDHDRLVIETTSKPMTVREVYALSDAGNTLTLVVELHSHQGGSRHVTRVFRRAPDSAR